MVYLVRQNVSTQGCALYRIEGDDSRINRYVASTKQTRDICNQPEIIGVKYTRRLQQAVTLALKGFPVVDVFTRDNKTWEHIFLRGGLNFGIREALHDAYGYNRHLTAYQSSQRACQDGKWGVFEDKYRKPITIPENSTLVLGDVVATGTTCEHGLNGIVEQLSQSEGSISNVVFFTIGGDNTERMLERFADNLAQQGQRPNVYVVYFEGRFGLVEEGHNLRIGIPGTDFVRTDETSLLAPEFEISQGERKSNVLERCTIYDAGSRAFDVKIHVDDVIEYWGGVEGLADQGFTLREALLERMPTSGCSDGVEYIERIRERWQNVPDQLEGQATETFLARQRLLNKGDTSAEALKVIARERIDTMTRLLR